MMHDLICIGVDQSYKRTGVSMSVDGTLLHVKSIELAKYTKHKSRMLVAEEVKRATYAALDAADHVIVILERIRMFSQQFVSMPYILSMGMMNGAVTCGTLDGANIEIVDYAGEENNYIFGATADEIKTLSAEGYLPNKLYDEDEQLHAVVDTLIDGTFDDCGTGDFADLYDSLLKGERPDYYFVLYDLNSYVETLLTINEDYENRVGFAKKQLVNTANSAYFSSDRTIKEYARDIWKI